MLRCHKVRACAQRRELKRLVNLRLSVSVAPVYCFLFPVSCLLSPVSCLVQSCTLAALSAAAAVCSLVNARGAHLVRSDRRSGTRAIYSEWSVRLSICPSVRLFVCSSEYAFMYACRNACTYSLHTRTVCMHVLTVCMLHVYASRSRSSFAFFVRVLRTRSRNGLTPRLSDITGGGRGVV